MLLLPIKEKKLVFAHVHLFLQTFYDSKLNKKEFYKKVCKSRNKYERGTLNCKGKQRYIFIADSQRWKTGHNIITVNGYKYPYDIINSVIFQKPGLPKIGSLIVTKISSQLYTKAFIERNISVFASYASEVYIIHGFPPGTLHMNGYNADFPYVWATDIIYTPFNVQLKILEYKPFNYHGQKVLFAKVKYIQSIIFKS